MVNPWTSYATVKYVVIPDRRLAVLKIGLTALILGYVIVVELVARNGYLQMFPVTGVVRFSLQQPTVDGCKPSEPDCYNDFLPLSQLDYCEQSYDETVTPSEKTETMALFKDQRRAGEMPLGSNSFLKQPLGGNPAQVSESRPPVSTAEGPGRVYKGPLYPCQIYEAINAQLIRETSVVVWTRAKTYNQTLVCHEDQHDDICPQTYRTIDETKPQDHSEKRIGPTNPFFIAQPEAFTLLIEHAVTSSTICRNEQESSKATTSPAGPQLNYRKDGSLIPPLYACSSEAKDYHGRLQSHSADLCAAEYPNAYDSPYSNITTTKPPCFIGPNHTVETNQDFFSIEVLLKAAGVHLDDCLHDKGNRKNGGGKATGSNETLACDTIRNQGGTLLLEIFWNDAIPWEGKVQPYYSYRAQWIGGSYKESQAFYYNSYRNGRILMEGHGIKIAVVLGGTFHQFQMLQFLVTLTTALGLLAVASVVVDNLMLYVLPDKDVYLQAKYDDVGDDSSFRLNSARRRTIPADDPDSSFLNSSSFLRNRFQGSASSTTRRRRQRLANLSLEDGTTDSVESSVSAPRPPTQREQSSLLESIVHREEESLHDANRNADLSTEPLLSHNDQALSV